MTVKQIRIADNIRLSHIQTNKFKTGVLTLTLTLPLSKENLALGQILPAVLRRGTERFSDMASIHRRLDELYAATVEIRCHRLGSNLLLSFSSEILDPAYIPDGEDVLNGVMDVIAQMLLHPKLEGNAFPQKDVSQEIRFACDSLHAEINNTRSYAMIRLSELMHREDACHPTLAQLEEGIRAIDGVSLYRFYRSVLTASPLEVFYVGSATPETLADRLLSNFRSWEGAASHTLRLPVAEQSAGFLSKTEQMPVSQGKLSMGFRTGVCSSDEGCAAMIVLNELLGGSPASKLFMQVREGMSLCYYCSSAYHKHSGILTVSAGIDPKNRDLTEKAILDQLNALKEGRISEAEWHAAKTSLENIYRQMYDNPFELQVFYGNRILFSMDETVESSRQRIARVTREEVVALAQQIVYDTVFFIEGTQSGSEEEEYDD